MFAAYNEYKKFGGNNIHSCFPGLTIRYTTDGTEPTIKSPEYKETVQVQGIVKVATFSSNGRTAE
ncbi:MAG: chitobiase/beta-hexosaminidase C-terminal domain-containing protein [Cytophagaceae bacterium]|nr:chitobiase/beta-hexosaminidase C-terminal domain-containing protein [Cytophagaceae bacterium]